MPKFQYKAKDMSGRIIEGVYEAPNQAAVIDMIRQKNYYHLEVNEVQERKDLTQMGMFSKIKTRDIALFCRQFSSILKAGVPMIQCINLLSEQTESKILAGVLENVADEIQKGATLSEAMGQHEEKFPPLLLNMIEAGEVSGTLDDTLETMATHFEKDYKLQQKVKSAMIYPIVVIIVAIVAVIFMLVAVVPMFVGLFDDAGGQLPLPTRVLVSMSEFLKSNGLIVAVIVAIVVIVIRFYLSSEEGRLRFDEKIIRAPIFGKLITKIMAARFSRTMGSLLDTGVPITEAIEITGRVLGNQHAAKGMRQVEEDVKQGKGLYLPIKSLEIFPPMVENMVLLGEESGTLVTMLNKTADFYEEEVDREVDNLTGLIEPAIIVFLGGSIGFIVIAMMLPMFDMLNLIESMD